MQVVSGPIGRERVHFEAPAAGIGHLWFITIHPFDDGNGRIARAVTDLALARSEKTPQRFYSMSAAIRAERKRYYEILESTQKGEIDITRWLRWFLGCLLRAFDRADESLKTVLAKAEFWNRHRDTPLSDRQRLVINRLLDEFVGKMTSSKWATITKTSQDTAARDIDDLVRKGILTRGPAGGRSTSCKLPSTVG